MPDRCYRCGEGEARICVSCADELARDEGRIVPPDWWPEWVRESAAWRAALYILDAPSVREHVRPFIDLEARRILFGGLVTAANWSLDQQALIQAAAWVFGAEDWTLAIADAAFVLDDQDYRRFVDAVRLYRDPSLLAGGDER